MKTLQHTIPVPQIPVKTFLITVCAALLALGSLSVAVSARAQSTAPTKADTTNTPNAPPLAPRTEH